MSMSQAQYAAQLQQQLPPGMVFQAEDGSTLAALLAGLAEEFSRVDARGDELLAQVFPDTTEDFLADWERVCGLPDECTADLVQTVAERQGAVVARLRANDTPTVAFLIAAAATLGYAITITENHEARYGMSYGGSYGGPAWNFTFTVALVSGDPLVTHRRYGDAYGELYADVTDPDLLCALGHLKPAHTIMFVAAA